MKAIAQKRRYPGVQPFSESQQGLFFGREDDIETLLPIIAKEKLLVLFGKSGYGKSSLINAGLVPRLKKSTKNKECQVISVRFHTEGQKDNLSPKKIFISELNRFSHIPNTEFYNKIYNDSSIWSEFKRRQRYPDSNIEQVFILFFDQFEEFFLFPPEQQMQFRTELSELLYTDIPQAVFHEFDNLDNPQKKHLSTPLEVHVVISIRSDRISYLDSMKNELADILKKLYELKGLSASHAQKAIEKPAQATLSGFASKPFRFSEPAMKSILHHLSRNGTQTDKSMKEEKFIETFQLQILCESIEQKVIEKNLQDINDVMIDVGDLPDFDKIFEAYYINRVESLMDEAKRNIARIVIEEELLYTDEIQGEARRLSMDSEVLVRNIKSKHNLELSKALLDELTESFLLRREETSRGINYEITHDTLIPAIIKARNARRTEEEHRKAILLAQQEEAENQKEARRAESERLRTIAEEQRSIAEKGRARARSLASISIFLALTAIAVGLYAFQQKMKVEHNYEALLLKEREKVLIELESYKRDIIDMREGDACPTKVVADRIHEIKENKDLNIQEINQQVVEILDMIKTCPFN